MNIIKVIEDLELEFSTEFPFEHENVNIYPNDIIENSTDKLIEKMYYYKYLCTTSKEKEDLENYLSYLSKLNSKGLFN